LAQHHKYSINDLENIIPFELDIYVNMLKEYIREQEEKQRNSGM
jgi:hypothetical protein